MINEDLKGSEMIQFDEIFNDMLQEAFKQKLISHDYIANKEDISNFYVMLLAIYSDAIAELYREANNKYNSTSGTEWAYKDYFSRLDGVEDYKIIPNWDGTGTIKCIVTPSNRYFLNKVYNELQANVTQATEDIVVLAPVNKQVDIYINCNVSTNEKDTIKSKVEVAVREYFSSMSIGEDLIPFKLGAYLDKQIVELKNIEFNYPTKPVTITDEEKCSLGELEIIME